MKKLIFMFVGCAVAMLLSGCYSKTATHDSYSDITEHQWDSLEFQSTHHYTNNYNFIVDVDSIVLLSQQPEEKVNDLPIDTFSVYKRDRLVVADIRMIPGDEVDSVWIQVAKDQSTFGWVHESELLPNVVPDDPISQFINIFSNNHLLIFLIFLVVVVAFYIIVKARKKHVHIVHFNDIDSFYPTLLCIIVACSATFYASLQVFAPELWRHFYYHPTLNPFSVPLLLNIFLVSVWAIVIIGIASVDDIRRKLPIGEAILYIGGMFAVCAVNYVLFSISTLYYIGYLLLAVYIILAVRQYLRHSYKPYVCGNCGSRMRHKGKCPHCGTMNY